MVELFETSRAMESRPCAEIQASAALLASLRGDDKLRMAAEAHATRCQPCAATLSEGAALMALIDDALAEESAGSSPSGVPSSGRGNDETRQETRTEA
jgi:hypothetical protein